VTVLKSGVVNINAAAHRAYFKDAKYILFGYDEATRKVAIKPLKEKNTTGAYSLRNTKSGSSVSGKGFLNIFGISHDESKSYRIEWDDELEAVVFTLADSKQESPVDNGNTDSRA